MTIFLGILGLYLALMCLLYFFQSRLMYFPEHRLISTPHELGLRYEAISLRTEDGVELSAWFVPAAAPRGVLLFCHGNAGNMSHRLASIQIFQQLGLSTFIFDYRGFGTSDGSPSEEGTYLDVKAAWDYLTQKRNVQPEAIILFGESMGGAVAAWLAQDHKPAGLILQSAFTSIKDIAASLYPFFPTSYLVRYGYDTQNYLRRVTCPILVAHSCDDDIVPYSHGVKLYETARGLKAFLELRGDHNIGFLVSDESYIEGIQQFSSKVLK